IDGGAALTAKRAWLARLALPLQVGAVMKRRSVLGLLRLAPRALLAAWLVVLASMACKSSVTGAPDAGQGRGLDARAAGGSPVPPAATQVARRELTPTILYDQPVGPVALDAAHVYTFSKGNVIQVPKKGGTARVLAPQLEQPSRIVAAGGWVAWPKR